MRSFSPPVFGAPGMGASFRVQVPNFEGSSRG